MLRATMLGSAGGATLALAGTGWAVHPGHISVISGLNCTCGLHELAGARLAVSRDADRFAAIGHLRCGLEMATK
jgi:hypothetical protein